jgi:hypothetical protein
MQFPLDGREKLSGVRQDAEDGSFSMTSSLFIYFWAGWLIKPQEVISFCQTLNSGYRLPHIPSQGLKARGLRFMEKSDATI